MNFVPASQEEQKIPYYDDVTAEDGWKGQETSKSIEKLKGEIKEVISRLGGTVTSFVQGVYHMGKDVRRDGFVIEYIVPIQGGSIFQGKISIAALPVRDDYRLHRTYSARKDKSLRMALFNVRDVLDGARILQILSPGYSALVPFMLGKDDKTISQLWSENAAIGKLLPPPSSDFIEGEIDE